MITTKTKIKFVCDLKTNVVKFNEFIIKLNDI